MKAKTEDPQEIKRFKRALEDLKERYEEYKEKYKEEDQPFFGYNEGSVFNDWTGYVTSSGKGKYWLSEDGKTLWFEGYRNSFMDGSGFLGFAPSPRGGWKVIKSREPNRPPFAKKIEVREDGVFVKVYLRKRSIFESDVERVREMAKALKEDLEEDEEDIAERWGLD